MFPSVLILFRCNSCESVLKDIEVEIQKANDYKTTQIQKNNLVEQEVRTRGNGCRARGNGCQTRGNGCRARGNGCTILIVVLAAVKQGVFRIFALFVDKLNNNSEIISQSDCRYTPGMRFFSGFPEISLLQLWK